MSPEQALDEIRKVTGEGLAANPLLGTWQALLHIQAALTHLEGSVVLSSEEARHVATILPSVGSTAVNIQELDWFEEHGQELTRKLER